MKIIWKSLVLLSSNREVYLRNIFLYMDIYSYIHVKRWLILLCEATVDVYLIFVANSFWTGFTCSNRQVLYLFLFKWASCGWLSKRNLWKPPLTACKSSAPQHLLFPRWRHESAASMDKSGARSSTWSNPQCPLPTAALLWCRDCSAHSRLHCGDSFLKYGCDPTETNVLQSPAPASMPHPRAAFLTPRRSNRVPQTGHRCARLSPQDRSALLLRQSTSPLQPCLFSQNVSGFPGKWAGLRCAFPKQKLSLAREWQQEGRATVSPKDPNLPITLLSLCQAGTHEPQARSRGGTHISAQRPTAPGSSKARFGSQEPRAVSGTSAWNGSKVTEPGFVCTNCCHAERTRLQEMLWKNWPKHLL